MEPQGNPMRHKRAIPNRSLRVSDQIQRDLGELIRRLRLGMALLWRMGVP